MGKLCNLIEETYLYESNLNRDQKMFLTNLGALTVGVGGMKYLYDENKKLGYINDYSQNKKAHYNDLNALLGDEKDKIDKLTVNQYEHAHNIGGKLVINDEINPNDTKISSGGFFGSEVDLKNFNGDTPIEFVKDHI